MGRITSYPAAAGNQSSKVPVVEGGSNKQADLGFGVYTPTLSHSVNVAASGPFACQWLRVGNVVTVSGMALVDPTATGETVLGISLPVASTFAGQRQCAGTAANSDSLGESGVVRAAIGGGSVALLCFNATSTAAKAWFFHFTYLAQ